MSLNQSTAAPPGVTAYPLCWPPGRPRTPPGHRRTSHFHQVSVEQSSFGNGTVRRKKALSLAEVRDELFAELARLGARRVVLSTSLRLRQDGLPASGQAQPADPGAAVYFSRKGRQVCFACDCWTRVEDNLRAIAKTVEALRGIARWGTGDMVDAAFTGFQALPAAAVTQRRWWQVLGVGEDATADEVSEAYRRLSWEHHPDREGDPDRMKELNAAWDEYRRDRGP
jgi:hypothetical protein